MSNLFKKEHYDLMSQFEFDYKGRNLIREKDKELWKKGYLYEDGYVNDLFLAYRKGYILGAEIA